MKLCKCGCGNPVSKPENAFIRYHSWSTGLTKETSVTILKAAQTGSNTAKLNYENGSRRAWHKGKSKITEAGLMKISKAVSLRRGGTGVKMTPIEWLCRKHKITVTEYERMFTEQNGLCAICKNPETAVNRGRTRQLCIDHDHATGRVRGLLCNACNRGIGYLRDDVTALGAAIAYLEKSKI